MSLHRRIMNLPCNAKSTDYKMGFRDARHAAAELAESTNQLVEALQAIANKNHSYIALHPQWVLRVTLAALAEYKKVDNG
jgi:hypothetical protein